MPQKKNNLGNSRPGDKLDRLGQVYYKQRDVLSLKKLSAWTEQEKEIHLKYNRILQQEFSDEDSKQLIQDAIVCKQEWLTDVVCPSPQAALTLNIAKELIVHYKVSEADLNKKTAEIFECIMRQPKILEDIRQKIELELQQQEQQIINEATRKCAAIYGDNFTHLDSFLHIERNITRKQLFNKYMNNYIKEFLQETKDQFSLQKKDIQYKGENVDYSFLGAAGSGKSFIMRGLIDQETLKNTILLSTDAYRGVFLPGTQSFEDQGTIQGFIKTQDTAYLIKELIQEELASMKQRPDVLLDCISLEKWHRTILTGNKETKSAVAALDDVRLVPKRAYDRATSQDSGPSDKGRYVNTTALLEGHSKASRFLLVNIPGNSKTTVYDTNPSSNTAITPIIATINTDNNKTIDIYDLDKFANYIGKANINQEAASSQEVYYKSDSLNHKFTYSTEDKANLIIKLINPAPNIFTSDIDPKDFKINFYDSDSNDPYCYIYNNNGKLELNVLDTQKFQQHLKTKPILKEIMQQLPYNGDLQKYRQEKQVLGDRFLKKNGRRSIISHARVLRKK